MRESELFPRRVRWLAVATGVASALALFPVWFFLYPALLITGGVIQPRHPRAGRWLVWLGAANLGVIIYVYDAIIFPHPWREPQIMVVPFSASTILLLWCYAELVVDGLKQMRARRSAPSSAPYPVSQGEWILAVVLSVLVGLHYLGLFIGWVFAPTANGYFHSIPLSSLAMSLVQAGTVVAFDISLLRGAAKLRSYGSGLIEDRGQQL